MRFVQLTFLLLVLYVALTGNLQLNNILVGAVVSAIIGALVRTQVSAVQLGRIPVILWAGAQYAVFVAADMIQSGFAAARLILDPKLPIRPGIVAIPSGCKSELATALSAHAITISPGEMVIGIGAGGLMYTHCLDASKAAVYAEQAQRLRRKLLSKIIE